MRNASILAALLFASSAFAQNTPSFSVDKVQEVSMADLTRKQLNVSISSNYQVQLSFPAAVDGVVGNKPNLLRVTVMPQPLDRFVFLDALAAAGEGDLTVFVAGQPLKIRFVIDNKKKDGVREYLVQEADAAPTVTATPAVTAAIAAMKNTTSANLPGKTVTVTAPATKTAAPAPNPAAPVAKAGAIIGMGAPVSAEFVTRRDGDSLIVEYAVTNAASGSLSANSEDIRVMHGGERLTVDHIRPSALSLILPSRTIKGTFRIQTASNDVHLVWPMRNLKTRANYAFEHDLSALTAAR